MRTKTFLLLAALCLLINSCSAPNPTVTAEIQAAADDDKKTDSNVRKTPVVVELFTSEGCSSCPPADRALSFLEKEQPVGGAEIIALALHVDYWNRLGWTDEFASPLFSQRQEIYARRFRLGSVYTPQMVVDGGAEFNGSNTGKATKTILEASKQPKASVELSPEENGSLKIKISEIPAAAAAATVFLAIAENNLSSEVKRGENSGQTLSHPAVVRELRSLGALEPQKKLFEAETPLSLPPAWKKENLKAVVFVQENQSRKIIGAGQVRLAGK